MTDPPVRLSMQDDIQREDDGPIDRPLDPRERQSHSPFVVLDCSSHLYTGRMPPKKKSQVITTTDTMAALDRLHMPSTNFSLGAVEALRVCHDQFVSLMASELALFCGDDAPITLQPEHVDKCLEKLGFADYCKVLCTKKRKQPAASARSSKKRKQWSTEMEAEQERLLAKSKQTVQQQQTQQP